MSEIPSLPTYEDISAALKLAGSQFDASQVHGLFCGYLCATNGKTESSLWRKVILGKKKSSRGLEVLENLYETSFHLLNEFSFEFNLILPSDSDDINKRTESLGLWCQGFLSGLEHFKISIKDQASSEVSEALDDILEISQVAFGDIIDDDEDETAYFELVEYVRLAILMLFHELNGRSISA